ncbi:AbiV family abortive infection protein [Bradyrhizobium elkanii]|uniref:AbiV family abortive infection protein n=1 Tax=Bradyrhizobium elkanii TaxID=29448 RepID=UPI0006851B11|nr:AbiV family abortive infection protein [Bradyrhizobium elkanii]
MGQKSALSDSQRALLAEITKGGLAAFENAERLFVEASILLKAKAYSRSLFLHQISMEELAKVERLGGLASGLLMGIEVDLSKATKGLTQHKAKNHLNAYMLPQSEAEQAAVERGDVEASLKAFSATQTAFHQKSNDAKNAALYVDFDGKTFVSPVERINAGMVAEIAKQNAEFLGLMAPKRDMLVKWNEDPDAVIPLVKTLKDATLRLRREYKDDPSKAMELLMEELFKTVS